MKNASQDTSANLSKDSPTCPERDTREGAHGHRSTDSTKESLNQPPHGHISHGFGRFLWECDPRTLPEDNWIEELADRFERWQDASEQAELEGWSE